MRRLIATSFLALMLTACATGPSAYGPAQSEKDLGFQTTKIESDRFRVNYTGRSEVEAQDYALLQVAEIAQAEGFSHFRVLTAQTYKEGARSSGVSSSIGISSGGRGYYGGGTSVGVGINLNDLGRAFGGEKVTHTMEVRLTNDASDDPNVYSAAEVTINIQPQSFK
jgi:hypothetical protein